MTKRWPSCPAAVPYFWPAATAMIRDEQSWAGALEMVQAVDGFFAAAPEKLSADDLQKRIGELQQNADLLRIHVDNLTRAFTTDLDRLLKVAQAARGAPIRKRWCRDRAGPATRPG